MFLPVCRIHHRNDLRHHLLPGAFVPFSPEPASPAGIPRILHITIIIGAERMLRVFLIALPLLSMLPLAGRGQIVINEIMYAPDAPEPEWVELHNAGPLPVDLGGWSIQDAGAVAGAIPSAVVPPGGYLVLARDSGRLRAVRAVGSDIAAVQLPVLNNAGDAVVLRDQERRAIDSVVYAEDWGGGNGASLERRSHAYPAAIDSSWGTSADRSGATPGRRNSLSPAALDLLVESLGFDQEAGIVAVWVRNAGADRSGPAELLLYYDADEDGLGAPAEELARGHLEMMVPGERILFEFRWPRDLTETGETALAEIRMGGDERRENDLASVAVRAPFLETGVVITEVMFDPLSAGARSGAEYVELLNTNTVAISIAGWKLYDATARAQATLPAQSPRMPPGGRLLVASDSVLFTRFPALLDSAGVVLMGNASLGLNGDEDDLVLRNRNGATVDSVHYFSRWHRSDLGEMKGVALERISIGGGSNDPRNWSSSASPLGGTPCAPNSVEIPPSGSPAVLAAVPATVSPDGDGYEDFTRISYRLPTRNARIVAGVYDRAGRQVRLLASNEPAAAEGELIWDGRDQDGRPLPPGIYLVRLEAYDDDGAGLFAAQGTVVVARKM